MTVTDPAVERQERERANRVSEYLNEATNHLYSSFDLSFPEVVISVLYEAASLVQNLPQEPSSSAEIDEVVRAVQWLSHICAEALVQERKCSITQKHFFLRAR